MENIIAVSIPIFICVVLPVAIVALVMNANKNKDNQRAKILLAYIEKSGSVDIEKMKELLADHKKTLREQALSNLKGGLICIGIGAVLLISAIFDMDSWYNSAAIIAGGIVLAIGIALVAMYFVTKKAAERSEAEHLMRKEEDSDNIEC